MFVSGTEPPLRGPSKKIPQDNEKMKKYQNAKIKTIKHKIILLRNEMKIKVEGKCADKLTSNLYPDFYADNFRCLNRCDFISTNFAKN